MRGSLRLRFLFLLIISTQSSDPARESEPRGFTDENFRSPYFSLPLYIKFQSRILIFNLKKLEFCAYETIFLSSKALPRFLWNFPLAEATILIFKSSVRIRQTELVFFKIFHFSSPPASTLWLPHLWKL